MADYIDKQEMTNEIKSYRELCQKARDEGKEKPQVPKSLMLKLMMMVDGIARRPNFRDYSFLDEMKSRAIENCFKKANYFDPEKSNNPFGFYSKLIWREFVNVIKDEEIEAYIKAKSFYNHEASYSSMIQDDDVDLTVEGFSVPYFDVEEFEAKNALTNKKKSGRKKKKIDGPLSYLEQPDEEEGCKEFEEVERFEVSK